MLAKRLFTIWLLMTLGCFFVHLAVDRDWNDLFNSSYWIGITMIVVYFNTKDIK